MNYGHLLIFAAKFFKLPKHIFLEKIFISGAAGFIGFHLSKRMLDEGWKVVGLDNVNDYYDVRLKEARLKILKEHREFTFYKNSLEDKEALDLIFRREKFDYVVNLAAQAGVRYSLENPYAYTSSNIQGFLNILEGCRHYPVKHLIYASSSSVYGANKKMPFSVQDNVDHPVSLYAATKKANELMAHTYSSLYKIPTTGLRFFTVYGPWGRPDMALFLFTKAILEGKPINVFNHGKMKRDFTFIDDIIEGVYRLVTHVPEVYPAWDGMQPDPATSYAPYRIFNIGNNKPEELSAFISILEKKLGKTAKKNLMPMQDGDVPATYADVDQLMEAVNFRPDTPLEAGIGKFVDWYREFYKA